MAKSFSMATMVPLMTGAFLGALGLEALLQHRGEIFAGLGVAMEFGFGTFFGSGASHSVIPVQSFMPIRGRSWPTDGLPR